MIEKIQHEERLVLEGPLTIRTIPAAHAALIEKMNRSAALVIDVGAVTEADLTLVQLLLSARCSAIAAGKRVTLAGAGSGPLYEVLVRGGLLRPDAEADEETDEDDAFWLEGATRI